MEEQSEVSADILLVESAKRHDLAGMQKALSLGAQLGTANEGGMTPLMWAVAMAQVGAVKKPQMGKQLEAIKWLALHSDVNALDRDGDTALIIAAKRVDEQSMRLLLADARINVDHLGCHGSAIRMVAGRSAACEAMLGERVDLSVRDAKGLGPLDWARTRGADALCELLLYRLAKEQSKELAAEVALGNETSVVAPRL